MPALVHWDIPSTDLATSRTFYSKLFGWKITRWSDDYALFQASGGSGGGIALVKRMPRPGIDVYIEVSDIERTLARAVALGGQVSRKKTEIGGGMGFMAFLLDPCGCRIGLWSKK